jgi:DNA-binding NarL/FixJ family response regulator
MGRRVLIVDDHPSFRRFATKLLRAGGFDVVGEAENGSSALAAMHRLRPELVLLDVLLPDMSGFDVVAALAADPMPPRVILVSSRSAGELGPALDGSKAEGFINKQELTLDALDELIGGAS